MSDNQNLPVDIETIIARRKVEWMEASRKRMGTLSRIEHSVPWWLIIISAVLFGLSAPHTAQIFARLTPFFGWFAPLAVEFGLLYAAFRRKRSRQRQEKVPWTLWLFEALMFLVAIIVNGAGTLEAVVSWVGIEKLSFADIVSRFGEQPVMTQVALFLVPIAALIIPIGTGVCGEGLATLVFEGEEKKDDLEERWALVEHDEVRRALYVEFVKYYDEREAKRKSELSAAGFTGQKLSRPRVSAPVEIPFVADMPKVSAMSVHELSAPRPGRNLDARQTVRDYLSTHPEVVDDISVRQLASVTGVSKSLAGEILKEWKETKG